MTTRSGMRHIGAYIENALWKRFKIRCIENDDIPSDILRDAIHAYVGDGDGGLRFEAMAAQLAEAQAEMDAPDA